MTVGSHVTSTNLTVQMNPRVSTTPTDMEAWHQAARSLERTECRLDRAAAELAALEGQLDAARLRPLTLLLRGDPRDPGHVNLPARINWLTIQVGNYSGRPTTAQMEWIAAYARQADEVVAMLERTRTGGL